LHQLSTLSRRRPLIKLLILQAVDWRDGKAIELEDIYKAYHSFSDLGMEVAKLQAQANAAQYSDIQIEATVIYERIFENLERLGVRKFVFLNAEKLIIVSFFKLWLFACSCNFVYLHANYVYYILY
jgi:hypothetical protein